MVVNSPLIRPAISWGGAGIGGAPLDSHDVLDDEPNLETMVFLFWIPAGYET